MPTIFCVNFKQMFFSHRKRNHTVKKAHTSQKNRLLALFVFYGALQSVGVRRRFARLWGMTVEKTSHRSHVASETSLLRGEVVTHLADTVFLSLGQIRRWPWRRDGAFFFWNGGRRWRIVGGGRRWIRRHRCLNAHVSSQIAAQHFVHNGLSRAQRLKPDSRHIFVQSTHSARPVRFLFPRHQKNSCGPRSFCVFFLQYIEPSINFKPLLFTCAACN